MLGGKGLIGEGRDARQQGTKRGGTGDEVNTTRGVNLDPDRVWARRVRGWTTEDTQSTSMTTTLGARPGQEGVRARVDCVKASFSFSF